MSDAEEEPTTEPTTTEPTEEAPTDEAPTDEEETTPEPTADEEETTPEPTAEEPAEEEEATTEPVEEEATPEPVEEETTTETVEEETTTEPTTTEPVEEETTTEPAAEEETTTEPAAEEATEKEPLTIDTNPEPTTPAPATPTPAPTTPTTPTATTTPTRTPTRSPVPKSSLPKPPKPTPRPVTPTRTPARTRSPTRTPGGEGDVGTPGGVNNPIKTDPELKAMIEQLEDVNSCRAFKRWKSSFLEKFEQFLGVDGTTQAQEAYITFRKNSTKFTKTVKKLQGLVEKGDVSEERCTVRGRSTISEMSKQLSQLTKEERELIPALAKDEEKRGYTKFHLGAVLVRDGFQEYKQMTLCCDIIMRLKDTSLKVVADKQQLEVIQQYNEQMKRFRDIMADLGLFEIMMKAWSYDDEEEEIIFICLKTGKIGCVGIKNCLDRGLLTAINDGKKLTGFEEALTKKEDKDEIIDLVKEALAK